jgi:deazaflavin-dependent oxidoreductase (nitroreductase family)
MEPGPADHLGDEDFCYLTTVGRVTGSPHTIEIWFGLVGESVYLLSGGGDRSDWVRNILRTPGVTVEIADRTLGGRARIVTDPEEDEAARDLLVAKYQPGYGGDLTNWRRRALVVAVDLASG